MLSSLDKLNVAEFFSVCVQLISHTAKITKSVIDDKSFNSRCKGIDMEVFTDADVKVQSTIYKGLRHVWPLLNVIGEEDEIYDGPLGFDLNSLNKNLLDPKQLFGEAIPSDVSLDKATVWIDPIDGTADFVKGDFACATTLIGLSLNSEARLGIIGKYYHTIENSDQLNFSPNCTFSDATCPRVFKLDLTQESLQPKILTPQPTIARPENLTAISSKSRRNPKLEEFIASISPAKVLYEGGCGNKVLAVLEDRAHVYIFPGESTKKWDTVSGEAIMKSFGGYMTNFAGVPFSYPEVKEDVVNKGGLLVTKSKDLHQELLSTLKE